MTTASDYVGARVREVRKRRGWTTAELADRCTELGMGISASVISDIEAGRVKGVVRKRRRITVDELLGIALALNAPPLFLLIPPDDGEEPYEITPTESESRRYVSAWFTGAGPILPRMPKAGDVRSYYAELPDELFPGMNSS